MEEDCRSPPYCCPKKRNKQEIINLQNPPYGSYLIYLITLTNILEYSIHLLSSNFYTSPPLTEQILLVSIYYNIYFFNIQHHQKLIYLFIQIQSIPSLHHYGDRNYLHHQAQTQYISRQLQIREKYIFKQLLHHKIEIQGIEIF